MKPFKVLVEFETVILATSAKEAEEKAPKVILQNDLPYSFATAKEITAIKELPDGWESDDRPWGGPNFDDRVMSEILS